MGFIYTKSGKLAKRLYFGAVLLFEGLYYTFKNRVLADGGTFLENELPTISQDAKLVLTPNAYKAGKLYSAVPNDGTGDFTVDRNCSATYVDEDGLIKTVAVNVLRIDWRTGEAVILRELQSTNLVKYSEDFSNDSWTKVNSSTVSANSNTAPDGTETAYTFNASTSSYGSILRQIINKIAETQYTLSFFVKKNNHRYVGLRIGSASSGDFYNFYDFDTDVIDNTVVANAPLSRVIEKDGWVRLSQTFTTTASPVATTDIAIVNASGSTVSPDGTEKLDVWGAQLEQASTASSYIPTNGTTVTRLADNISVPTPAGVTSITETKNGVEQTPITTIPTTYSLPVGNINKVKML